jgi:hypothetical protein
MIFRLVVQLRPVLSTKVFHCFLLLVAWSEHVRDMMSSTQKHHVDVQHGMNRRDNVERESYRAQRWYKERPP